jgi:hypothetical protein
MLPALRVARKIGEVACTVWDQTNIDTAPIQTYKRLSNSLEVNHGKT